MLTFKIDVDEVIVLTLTKQFGCFLSILSYRWLSSCFQWVMCWLDGFLYANSMLSQQRPVLISSGLSRPRHSIRRSWRERVHFLPCRNNRASSSRLTRMQRILLAKVLPLSENEVDPLSKQERKWKQLARLQSTAVEKSSAAKRGKHTKPMSTTDAKTFTLEELQKEDGGWFTIKPAVKIAALCWGRYSYHRCVDYRMRAPPNGEGGMVVLNTPLRRRRKYTACVFYCAKRILICESLLSPTSPSWLWVFLWKSAALSTTREGRESLVGYEERNVTWPLHKL